MLAVALVRTHVAEPSDRAESRERGAEWRSNDYIVTFRDDETDPRARRTGS
jgi:hypothetical protein